MPAHGTGQSLDEEFLALVYGDEELLTAEFEAIIAANWPAPPVAPRHGPRRAHGRRPSDGRVVRRRGRLTGVDRAEPRERSPPHRSWWDRHPSSAVSSSPTL